MTQATVPPRSRRAIPAVRCPCPLPLRRSDILGRGLVTSEGEVWRAHRKLLSPAFDYRALERLQTVFEGAAARMRCVITSDAACLLRGGESSLGPPRSSILAPQRPHRAGVRRQDAGGGGVQSVAHEAGPLRRQHPAFRAARRRGRPHRRLRHHGAVLRLPTGHLRGAAGSRAHGRTVSSTHSPLCPPACAQVISQVALGFKPEEASIFPALFETVVDELNLRVFQPWRTFLPSAAAHNRSMATLNAIVQDRITARRAERAATTAPLGTETRRADLRVSAGAANSPVQPGLLSIAAHR